MDTYCPVLDNDDYALLRKPKVPGGSQSSGSPGAQEFSFATFRTLRSRVVDPMRHRIQESRTNGRLKVRIQNLKAQSFQKALTREYA